MAEEIWVCANGAVNKWEGDIFEFKEHLRKRIEKDKKKRAALGGKAI